MTDAFQKLFAQMLEQGQEMARSFNPAMENFTVAGFDKMMPTLSKDMMEMWFGKTFNREGLDSKTRLLVTVAALIPQSGWMAVRFGPRRVFLAAIAVFTLASVGCAASTSL